MVTPRYAGARRAALIPFLFTLLLGACGVDILGFLVSGDLEERQDERNNLVFLDGRFQTLNTGDSYSFVVLSDTHIEGGGAFGLERLAEALREEDAFVVITGDVTQSGERRDVNRFIEIARDIEAAWGIPCYPVLGNHDVYFNHWPVWKELIGSSTYRVDSDTATLFILDTANASLGASQLSWFEAELESAKPRVFVFTHVNFFVEHPGDLQQITDVRERARIMALLSGRCDALFSGHVHKRIVKNLGGVQYITIEDFRDNKTYCRVTVSPQGLSWEFFQL
ncbi:MAG: metallophosphoesterase [Treponema sp.]|jgi:3',5'-cyclic AMP phosphodiesterase CpdA|nr:metallophosphoesterase [Treponema sp.]